MLQFPLLSWRVPQWMHVSLHSGDDIVNKTHVVNVALSRQFWWINSAFVIYLWIDRCSAHKWNAIIILFVTNTQQTHTYGKISMFERPTEYAFKV